MKWDARVSLGAVVLIWAVSAAWADTSAFKIVDDPKLDKAVAETREEFLKKRKYDRLDATVLLPDLDGTWRRGSYNPESTAYPASCVKLAYLAAAMHWCRTNNHLYDYLDRAVRPMITKSDNEQTGVVVDVITGAPNLPDVTTATSEFTKWVEARRYTERFLASRGLLGNQVILHKTYPSNSGSEPVGAEKLAREKFGMNRMQPKLSASLMLEIVKGALEPGATEYMRSLLRHDRWTDYSVLGFGLPPGSLNENKLGVAYDTVEDIQYAKLPNGKEFILAVFTNGRDRGQPLPHDCSHLGLFSELLIERLGLDEKLPPKVRVDNDDPEFKMVGEWSRGPEDVYQWGASWLRAPQGAGDIRAAWDLNVPEAGNYEVTAWYPEGKDNATDAPYTVYHAGGSTTVKVNQQVAGGRWMRLGDFEFRKGEGRVELTNAGNGDNLFVVADAVKATKWPEQPEFAPPVAPPFTTPAPIMVLVKRINLTTDTADPKRPKARAVVEVVDNLQRPVADAEVVGSFIGCFEKKVLGTTDDQGRVTLETDHYRKSKSLGPDAMIYTFYVETVKSQNLRFDAGASSMTHVTWNE